MPEVNLSEIKSQVDTLGQTWNETIQAHKLELEKKDMIITETVKRAADDLTKKHEELMQMVEALQTKLNRTNAYGDGGNPTTKTGNTLSKAEQLEQFNDYRLQLWQGKASPDGPGATVKLATQDEYTAYTKAFTAWVRYGEERMKGTEHMKALSIGSDPDGGAWIAPPQMANWIVTRTFETSPIRKIATVQPISTHTFRIPEDPNQFAAGWVSETGVRNQTATATVGYKEITPQELFAMPPVTQQLLEDSAVDVERWIAMKTADRLSRVENTAFVNGSGAGQARGFLTYPSGTNWGQIQQIGTGTSGAFTYPALINLITSIKDVYQDGSSFVIQRQSMASIVTLTDTNGRYIFQPILNGNFNNTPLLGYTLMYATDMPAVAAGALALGFGDFKQGYIIVDRVGLSVLRDPYTAKPFVLFYTRKRTGGDVQDFDAIKLLVLT